LSLLFLDGYYAVAGSDYSRNKKIKVK